MDIFSDYYKTEAVKHLSGEDAQLFVDVVDEVLPRAFTSEDTTDLSPNFPTDVV